MAYEAPAASKGWKTKNEWVKASGIPKRTFENQLARLLELGHAKKARFTNENGLTRLYYWINNLSDEN